MNGDYVFLTEKEAMWAGMLEQVLRDNDVPCVCVPVLGAGVTLKTGVQERYRLFVPKEKLAEAEQLREELFSGEALPVAPEDLEHEEA